MTRKNNFRIRTITAGIELSNVNERHSIDLAVSRLKQARTRFNAEGYEVQTLRISTQALPRYLPNWQQSESIKLIQTLDRHVADLDVVLSIGPVITDDQHLPGFADWAADVIAATERTSMTVAVSSLEQGIHYQSINAAAEAIAAISRSVPGGEGNFRFAASAFIPPGTPFFPAAYHSGEDALSLGLESPNLLQATFQNVNKLAEVEKALRISLETSFKPLEQLAIRVCKELGLHYRGLDVSPAPGPDASIGQAIETLIDAPFGSGSTLSACAAITDVLKNLDIQTCGYSGLMLPVVEDTVLAKRAAEGRFSVAELLLYSSVCGTGLDVIPLAGDIPASKLVSVIGDVAALAKKYQKPLSARLFPIPGKSPGESVSFDNPYLMDSVIMDL